MKTSTLISYIFYFSSLSVARGAALSSSLSTNVTTTSATQLSTSAGSASPTFSANSTASSTTTFSASATSASAATSLASSSSVTVSAQPTPSLTASTAQDVETITERRLVNIVGEATNASSIASWLSTLEPDGQWPDLDYTTGCPAQRANWPAELHWNRISTMAAAWHGGLVGAEEYAQDPSLRASLSVAIGYWFSNDFTNVACLASGGDAACPCSTPGFWNTNWFSNILMHQVQELVSASCLLLNDTLLPTELSNCTTITGRAYATIDQNINGVGFLTGANLLDVAKIGIDQALLTVNVSMLTDAYARVHQEVLIANGIAADGIRADGSFGQHAGILYNGNYGKDYTNDVVDLEIEAGNTQFEATPASQTALATLLDGDRWMIYTNALTGVLHWDFSVLGRFIAFPTADITQATASILLNLTKIEALGQEWNSSTLETFSSTLSTNVTNANAGKLEGNRMFYDNDYMVQRGSAYVTTLKMYSTRSRNTECTNLANPFGFHLSDGALRTYVQGNEYEDIAASMDWNLIPGITVNLNATPLNCAQTQFVGIENFVGGASDGQRGVAAMRYTNPLTHNLHWQKTWFFLDDDVQLVMVANISSATNATVASVLDQRLHDGPIVLDGTTSVLQSSSKPGAQSLWHGNVGYTLPDSSAFSLSINVGEKFGNWTVIGTSPQPPETVDLFSAWISHDSLNTSLAYTIYPGTDLETFVKKSSESRISVIQNDASISAALDPVHSTIMAVFWAAGGGSFNITRSTPATPQFSVSTNGTAAVIFNFESGSLTVSDPTQTLSAVSVTLSANGITSGSKTIAFTLPSGGVAGSSVSQNVYQ
ncbi:polysaccharide lyase family 8 protein [Mycena galericulata]|nr:polysaccharide lyase family 8 protein [Mycena galericulata]